MHTFTSRLVEPDLMFIKHNIKSLIIKPQITLLVVLQNYKSHSGSPSRHYISWRHVSAGAVANAFGRIIWGLILDRIGTRATFTIAFFLQVGWYLIHIPLMLPGVQPGVGYFHVELETLLQLCQLVTMPKWEQIIIVFTIFRCLSCQVPTTRPYYTTVQASGNINPWFKVIRIRIIGRGHSCGAAKQTWSVI